MSGKTTPFQLVLALLAIWGAVLSVESWFRSPGAVLGPGLPPKRLELGGRVFTRNREPLHRRSVKDLPSAAKLIRHWGVVYEGQDGENDRFALLAFESTGSGRASRLPVKRLKEWLVEDDLEGEGGCLVRKPTGEAALLSTDEAWDAMQAARRRNPLMTTLPWLLGFRSIEDVRCLWLVTETRPDGTQLHRLADALLGPSPRGR